MQYKLFGYQIGRKHPKRTFPTLLFLCSHPPPCPCVIRQVHLFSTLGLPWDAGTHLSDVQWLPTSLRKQPKLCTEALESDLAQLPSPTSTPTKPCHAHCWATWASFPSLDLSLFLWTGMIFPQFFTWLGFFHASDHRSSITSSGDFPYVTLSCGPCPVTFHHATGSSTACTTINNYLLLKSKTIGKSLYL